MKHNHSIAIGGLALVMASVLTPGGAHAYEQGRVFKANPASYCQAALPVFDGNIRKRPLALRNEGQGSAFVTCSLTGQDDALVWASMRVSASIFNGQHEVSCTGVTGTEGADNQFVTKTFTPTVFETTMQFVWWGTDFEGAPSRIPGDGLFSISCNLPPGATILESGILFYENVGP